MKSETLPPPNHQQYTTYFQIGALFFHQFEQMYKKKEMRYFTRQEADSTLETIIVLNLLRSDNIQIFLQH